MTFLGRKATHELCLKQGRPSPYAEEFAEVKETIAETEKVAQEAPKAVKKGKEKQDG